MKERIKKVLIAESYERKDKGSVKSRKLWKKGWRKCYINGSYERKEVLTDWKLQKINNQIKKK